MPGRLGQPVLRLAARPGLVEPRVAGAQRQALRADPEGDGYSLFGFFTGMLFFKGVLVSMAGPTPNYAIQHVLSTRSPREAALENMMMALVRWGRGSC